MGFQPMRNIPIVEAAFHPNFSAGRSRFCASDSRQHGLEAHVTDASLTAALVRDVC